MSYARFGWGGSDVYVFRSVDGYLVCCACFLQLVDDGPTGDWRTPTSGPPSTPREPSRPLPSTAYLEMLAHLAEHAEHKHHVPDLTMSRLQRERAEAIEYEMEQ